MFICGTASFENESHSISPSSTPKRSKSFCRIGKNSGGSKNPYASRGLDKFYALLADLDDKKQKIYTQLGSDDVSFVRFVYSNESDQVKPIVVKSNKEKNRRSPAGSGTDEHPNDSENPKVLSDVKIDDDQESKEKKKKRLTRGDGAGFKVEMLRQPRYYVPAIIVLILLFLVVYGRTFAILCTSIGWYLIPTVSNNGGGATSRQSRQSGARKTAAKTRKKEFTRKVTASKKEEGTSSSSPRSVINGLNINDKERQIGHRRSF